LAQACWLFRPAFCSPETPLAAMLQSTGAILLALSGFVAAHDASITRCVSNCERQNGCRSSLDTYSCESACSVSCKCKAMSARMLNKPKHCHASMLAKEHMKRLSLRKTGARLSKVVLQDTQPAFEAFVPVADTFSDAPPQMLNRPPAKMLANQVRHRRHSHRHQGLLQKGKNATAAVTKAAKAAAPANPTAKTNASAAAKPLSALQLEEGRWVMALDRDLKTKMLIQVKHTAPTIKDPCGGLGCQQEMTCPAGFVSTKFPGHCCPYCVNPNVKVEKEAEGASGKYGGKASAMPSCANVWCFPTLCTKPLSNPTTTNGQCCATCPAL